MSSLMIDVFWVILSVWGILSLIPLVRNAYREAVRDIKGKVKVD